MSSSINIQYDWIFLPSGNILLNVCTNGIKRQSKLPFDTTIGELKQEIASLSIK